MNQKKKIAILGAGGWGTALAALVGRKGLEVNLWARRPEFAEELGRVRENRRYLPGVYLAEAVGLTSGMEEVLDDAGTVIFAVPSHGMRQVANMARPFWPPSAVAVSATKGLEEGTWARMSRVLREVLGDIPIGVLSGPNHAEEVGRGLPAAAVVAAAESELAFYLQGIFAEGNLRVYTNPDVVGVELGGSLKNVVALAAGMAEGLGLGDNAKAALLTRGLAEMARLGVALGAREATFYGLSGLGDLVVTCASAHSRNRRAGVELGQGRSLTEITGGTPMVIEGVRTAKAAAVLARDARVQMPVGEVVWRVLFGGLSPVQGVSALMGRPLTDEVGQFQGTDARTGA